MEVRSFTTDVFPVFIINLCFRALSYHWAKLPYENLLRVIFP